MTILQTKQFVRLFISLNLHAVRSILSAESAQHDPFPGPTRLAHKLASDYCLNARLQVNN